MQKWRVDNGKNQTDQPIPPAILQLASTRTSGIIIAGIIERKTNTVLSVKQFSRAAKSVKTNEILIKRSAEKYSLFLAKNNIYNYLGYTPNNFPTNIFHPRLVRFVDVVKTVRVRQSERKREKQKWEREGRKKIFPHAKKCYFYALNSFSSRSVVFLRRFEKKIKQERLSWNQREANEGQKAIIWISFVSEIVGNTIAKVKQNTK